jgi:hypothetical protein
LALLTSFTQDGVLFSVVSKRAKVFYKYSHTALSLASKTSFSISNDWSTEVEDREIPIITTSNLSSISVTDRPFAPFYVNSYLEAVISPKVSSNTVNSAGVFSLSCDLEIQLATISLFDKVETPFSLSKNSKKLKDSLPVNKKVSQNTVLSIGAPAPLYNSNTHLLIFCIVVASTIHTVSITHSVFPLGFKKQLNSVTFFSIHQSVKKKTNSSIF